MSIFRSKSPPRFADGIIGDKTWMMALKNAEPMQDSEQTVFSCPHCGGNETKRKHGKIVCAYCGSEIIGANKEHGVIPDVPAITNYETN